MKVFFKSSLITSTLLLVLGVLLVFQSEATITTISYIIGAVLICAGVLAFLRYLKTNKAGLELSELDVIYGIVTIIVGILVIKNPHVIASIIPIILGIAIIISSTVKIQYAFDLKNSNNDLWKTTMLIAIVSTICGVVLLFNPFVGAILIMKFVGIFIVAYALLDFASTIIIKRNVSSFNATAEEVTEAEIIIKEEQPEAIKEIPIAEEKKNVAKKNNSKKSSTSSKSTKTKAKTTKKETEEKDK